MSRRRRDVFDWIDLIRWVRWCLLGGQLAPILAETSKEKASPLAGGGSLYLESFAVTDDFVFASHPPFATKPLKDSEVTVDVPKSVALDGKQKVGKAAPQKKVTLD